mmetsp:Transcript_41685/g.138629  ORF Transcript_41685/g.138629 Transcript_41685/m.138629 type:complete len:215 (-) Transcript_41685:668-1312(-)
MIRSPPLCRRIGTWRANLSLSSRPPLAHRCERPLDRVRRDGRTRYARPLRSRRGLRGGARPADTARAAHRRHVPRAARALARGGPRCALRRGVFAGGLPPPRQWAQSSESERLRVRVLVLAAAEPLALSVGQLWRLGLALRRQIGCGGAGEGGAGAGAQRPLRQQKDARAVGAAPAPPLLGHALAARRVGLSAVPNPKAERVHALALEAVVVQV